MTEFGVEWDTNVLAYIPSGDISLVNRGFYKKGYISVTLESWKYAKQSKCIASLEAQMGVFTSKNPEKFNVSHFFEVCENFTQMFAKIASKRKVQISGKQYDVLIYVDSHMKDEKQNSKYYTDCAKTKLSQNGGYTDQFMKKNIVGTPQITIGIKLPYIISLFSYISLLYDERRKRKKNVLLQVIFNTYVHTGYFCETEKITDLHIIGFLILCGYYLLSSILARNTPRKSYIKSFFGFKLRTNLRIIYDYVGQPKKYVEDYIKYISAREGSEHKAVYDSFLKNLLNPSIGSVHNRIISVTQDEKQAEGRKIFLHWWYNPKEHGSYIDFGEWDMGEFGQIHLEFRAIAMFLQYFSNKPNVNFEQFYLLRPDVFCKEIRNVFDTILSPALKINPKIILAEE